MRELMIWSLCLAVAIGVPSTFAPRPALAHGGQIETSGGTHGPISLTPAQVKALGVQTAPAGERPMETLLAVHGELAALPNAQADVSLRISGTVRVVYVNLGDRVRKGDKLALIESRVVGSPPPSVVIPAPLDGIVDARNIIVGQSVEPNTTLFHVSNISRMRVVGKVYEEDLGKVRVGQPAHVKVLAYPNEIFDGSVAFVGPTLDAETRTIEISVELDNGKGLLKPNLFASVDVVLGANKAALAVPNSAVLEAGGEKFVFVRAGDKYNRVDIETGAIDDRYTEVRSGLVPGDEVVTVGARELYTRWLMGSAASKEAD